MIIPYGFREAKPFSEGLAAVENAFGNWGFINELGYSIIPLQYEAVEDFIGGLAAVKINDLWAFIDKKGKITIPPKYNQVIENNFTEGKSLVAKIFI